MILVGNDNYITILFQKSQVFFMPIINIELAVGINELGRCPCTYQSSEIGTLMLAMAEKTGKE
jgi:hypothetical protein